MKRTVLSISLVLSLVLSLTVTSFAQVQGVTEVTDQNNAEPAVTASAAADADTNAGAAADAGEGKTKVSLYGQVFLFENDIICRDGVYYVPLREISKALGAICFWDAPSKTCKVVAADNSVTFSVTIGSDIIEAKDRVMPMEGSCMMQGNTMYIPARNFARVMGMSYWTDEVYNKILFAAGQPLKSAAEVYNADDLKWMSRIIYAEAKGESFKGKIAVGNVVMNRVNSPKFPNTVYNVIFARNQFTPARTGSINNTPDSDSIRAAKLALEGYNVVPECVYFVNERISTSSWFRRTRTLMFKIGSHSFYK